MTFESIAAEAVGILAREMVQYGEFQANWQAIDKICRRWPRLSSIAHGIIGRAREYKRQEARKAALAAWARNDNAFHVMASPYA